MYIIIVDDDHNFVQLLNDRLKDKFKNVKIHRIKTEFEFRSEMNEIVKKPPDLFLIDIMMRWADPSENMPEASPEVLEGGYPKAGLRCQRLLTADERTKNIPIILYTILERRDLASELQELPGNVQYLRKDSNLLPLLNLIDTLADPRSND
jgi:CheY-like chemotaxis protein